jgi:hypothetical protein
MSGQDGVAIFSGPNLQCMGGMKATGQPGNDSGDNVFPHDKARVLRVRAKLPDCNALNVQIKTPFLDGQRVIVQSQAGLLFQAA